MSFGKRGPGERTWNKAPAKAVLSSSPSIPNAEIELGPDDEAYERIANKQRKRSEGASKMWTATFIIVAIVGVMLAVNMTVTMSVANMFSGDDSQTEEGYPAGVAMEEVDRIDKALARACQPPNAARIAQLAFFPTNYIWLTGTRYGGGMKIHHAPKYFSCIMVTEPKRFCHPFYREQLARQLKDYTRKIKSARAYEAAQGANPMAQNMKRMFEEVRDQINAHSGGRIEHNRLPTGIDPQISEGMISLSRKGMLSKSDFGWFGIGLPLDLKPFLAPAESRPTC